MVQNNIIRKRFIRVLKEYGLKLKFVSDKVGIEYTTLSKWKNEHFDFGEDKLRDLKNFLNKYQTE